MAKYIPHFVVIVCQDELPVESDRVLISIYNQLYNS